MPEWNREIIVMQIGTDTLCGRLGDDGCGVVGRRKGVSPDLLPVPDL
jgi:hypothetical protein